MSKTLIRSAGLVVGLMAIVASGEAADLGRRVMKPSMPVMTQFNPWMVRVRALAVIPESNTKSVYVNGGRVDGGKVDFTNSIVPEIDISYFFTKNIAAELILATTPHTAKGKGSLSSLGKLGSVWLLPPTLTLQYHFTDFGAFKPYIGAGLNYTFFYGTKDKSLSQVKFDNQLGLAAQVGFDYMIDKNWGFNFDVKKLYLQSAMKGNLVNATTGAVSQVKTKAKLNPWLVGTGVTYRF